jgi:hypothetical protein
MFSSEDASDIPNEASPASLNVEYKYGQVRTRVGYDAYGAGTPLSGDVLGVFTHAESTGSTYPMALTKANVYRDVAGTWTAKDGAETPAATWALPWSWTAINDLLILSSQPTPIYSYDANGDTFQKVAAADGAEDIKARVVIQFAERLVLFNTVETTDGTKPHRARWTVPDPGLVNQTDFTATGSGTFELVSGDERSPIVGAELMGDQLYVFKEESIFRGVATGIAADALHFTPVVTHRGCGAQRTLKRVANNIFFMGNDGGIYIFGERGETIVDRIDLPIRPDLFDSLNMSYLYTSFAWVFEEDTVYRIYVPTGAATEPDVGFEYNYLEKTWSELAYTTAPTAAGMHGRLQIFGDTSGNIFREDEDDYDDNTVGYASWFTTKDFRFYGLDRRTRYDHLSYNVKGVGTFYVDYSVDEGANWVNFDSQTLTATFTRYVSHIDVSAKRMRFRFRTDAAADSYFFLREYAVRGRKGAAW